MKRKTFLLLYFLSFYFSGTYQHHFAPFDLDGRRRRNGGPVVGPEPRVRQVPALARSQTGNFRILDTIGDVENIKGGKGEKDTNDFRDTCVCDPHKEKCPSVPLKCNNELTKCECVRKKAQNRERKRPSSIQSSSASSAHF